jgi:hypothetical protein
MSGFVGRRSVGNRQDLAVCASMILFCFSGQVLRVGASRLVVPALAEPDIHFLPQADLVLLLDSAFKRHGPYGAKGAICQVASGVPGLPVLPIVAPFISQT